MIYPQPSKLKLILWLSSVFVVAVVVEPAMMLVDIRVFAHQYRDVRVVHDVVADASHQRAPESSHATAAQNDQRRLILLGNFDNYLPWLPSNAFNMAAKLQGKEDRKSVAD